VDALPPEAEDFLRTHTRTFLVTVRTDGAPACRPMVGLWHDGALWMTTYRKSAKARHIAHEPRVACVVTTDDADPVRRAVVLRGRAEILEPGATMPWAAVSARAAGAGADVARQVAARLAEGKRIVVRVAPEEARVL
jgi:PPOX class probable F420-dependent enzyme